MGRGVVSDPAAIVTTSRDKLRAFVLGVKAGEFDHLIGART